MDDVILRTSEDIADYASMFVSNDERDDEKLSQAEKAHRYIMDYADTHNAREVRAFASEMADFYREFLSERANVYQWYATHIVAE